MAGAGMSEGLSVSCPPLTRRRMRPEPRMEDSGTVVYVPYTYPVTGGARSSAIRSGALLQTMSVVGFHLQGSHTADSVPYLSRNGGPPSAAIHSGASLPA